MYMAQYERPNNNNNYNSNKNDGAPKRKVWNNARNTRPQRRNRNNDPWWMRDEESNNPRILPKYKPWWFDLNLQNVDDSWKVPDLKIEAERRCIEGYKSMKKAELIAALSAK